MGVTDLWDILESIKVSKNLKEIKGRKLAVDLAAWICEAENVKQLQKHVKNPCLRNLFFRTLAFSAHGIQLLFVLDGRAPELKWKTISRRINGGAGEGSSHAYGVRSGLDRKFKQCTVLLDCLGIPWITCQGEAEALCAQLNNENFVDGVITNDGDAFLYGAKTVYKNLTTTKQGFIADVYELSDIEESLNMNRNSLISLGLLLGCDYAPKGVPGVGKANAVELLNYWKGKDPLVRLQRWKDKDYLPTNALKQPKKHTHCSSCHHIGSKSEHRNVGCKVCGSRCGAAIKSILSCSCEWHQYEAIRKTKAVKYKIREAASKLNDFPDEGIIKEFLSNKKAYHKYNKESMNQRRPQISKAVETLFDTMGSNKEYWLSKVTSIAAKWALSNSNTDVAQEVITANKIVKTRTQNFENCFEIEWKIQEENFPLEEEQRIVSTIEPADLVRMAYPELVDEFEAAKLKSKQKKGKKDTVESKKITDFFNTRKKREIAEIIPKVKDTSKTTISSKSEKTIDEEICKTTSVESKREVKLSSATQSVKNEKIKTTQGKENHSSKSNAFSSYRPVIFASSDSDSSADEDFTVKTTKMTLNKPTRDDENDITFSQDLNFSLGLNTPAKPQSSVIAKPVTQLDRVLKTKDENLPMTPVRKTMSVVEADSPVFLSLFERLKLRKKQLN